MPYRRVFRRAPVNRRKIVRRKIVRKRRRGLIGRALFPVYRARPERKCFDWKPFWSAETIDDYTAYSVFSLNGGISGGTGVTNRIGNKIYVKSLHITGQVRSSVSNSASTVRIAVVLDRSPSGVVTPTWSDVWESTGQTVSNLFPLRNDSTSTRYVVLASKVFQVGYITQTGTGDASLGSAALPRKYVNIYKKMNLPVAYTDANANTIQTNNIAIFAWSDTNSNTPVADMCCRVEFTDS